MDVHEASEKELEWLSYTCDSTELMALNLRKTLAGVAALVADEMDRGGLRSGVFQPHDLPELMYGAADTLGVIEEMTVIGRDASFELRERYRKRAENLAEQLARRSHSEMQARADPAVAATARVSVTRPRTNSVNTNAGELERA
jgi:hypothetical protein